MASTPLLQTFLFYIECATALLLAVRKCPNISGRHRSDTSILMPTLTGLGRVRCVLQLMYPCDLASSLS